MNWQILVAISVITYSISVLLQRVFLKNDKVDSVAFSIIFQLATGLLILVYAILRGFSVPNLVPLIPNLILTIILYGAGNVLIFKALKVVEASEFTIVFATRTIWTITAAILLLGEHFSLSQVLGTLLILSSLILVSWRKGLKPGSGVLLSLTAAAFFGLAFINDAFIIRNFDVPSYLSIAFIAPALAIWMLFPKSTIKMRLMIEKKFLEKLAILSIFYAVSAITIFLAYQVGRNAAQIAPLNQTSTILTVILAIVFLKEGTQLGKKLLGAILSFIGIVLVG